MRPRPELLNFSPEIRKLPFINFARDRQPLLLLKFVPSGASEPPYHAINSSWVISEIHEIDLGGADDKIRQRPESVLLIGSSEPRIVAIPRILRSVVAARKRGPIAGTQGAVQPVVGDLTCHPEQLLILGGCHGGDHFLLVCISCNFCVETHELPDTPRSAAQSGSAVQD